MEKAIEIKRRAQRCILNGDLNGALAEYEKLVAIGDPDPYYCVLLADLLYKMGSAAEAQKRYLEAIQGYANSGLFKNGIAVCKKMSRLSLAPIDVSQWLAKLYAQDGLTTEAGIAYQQLAEILVKNERVDEARTALQEAINLSPEVGRLHERLGEVEVLAGNDEAAGNALSDAAERYERAGQQSDVRRCRSRIAQLRLATPPRPKSAGDTPHVEEPDDDKHGGPPVATSDSIPKWEVPEPGELQTEPLGISHRPPGDSDDEEDIASILEPPAPVAVEHGFGRLDETARASELDMSGSDEVTHDEPEPDEPPAEEMEVEEPKPQPLRLAAKSKDGAKGRPLSIVGREEEEYEDDEVAETNGPVPAPVDETEESEDVEPVAPPALRIAEPPSKARGDKEAPPAAPPRAPAPEVPAGPPMFVDRPPASRPTPAGPPAPPKEEPREAPGIGIQRMGEGATPAQPGLGAVTGDELSVVGSGEQEDAGLAQVSLLLAEAQACFHAGDRDAATIALIRAAQSYDQMGRFDSAVAIYRSLGQSPDVSLQLMMLWLKNCQRRNDRREASRVACDLGDRALNDQDIPAAREWFERAHSFDPENELAARRLKTLDGGAAPPPASPVPPGITTVQSSADAGGHVNVRTERDEPVIVDLGTVIEEFQRAIEPELASDPQGHYDLGMSYREMGLTEQAVHSLRIAAKTPAFRLRAGELAGRCLLDLGHFDEAAEVFNDALKAPDLLPTAAVDLRYQLALALEAAGRSPEALSEFERVYAAQANYPDVAMKIRMLRKAVGAA